MDSRAHKLLTLYKALHPKDNVRRFYIKRIEGGSGLVNIEQCVEDAKIGLLLYVHNIQERLISAAWRLSAKQELTDPPKITKQRRQTKRKQGGKNERRHGQFIKDTDDIAGIKSKNWLQNGHLQLARESLITSAQVQRIRLKNIKTKIDSTRNVPKCWIVNPMLKQSFTLFLSVLNFLKKNTSDNLTGYERLCIWILVERMALMFQRNSTNTNLYLVEKMNLKVLGTLTLKRAM